MPGFEQGTLARWLPVGRDQGVSGFHVGSSRRPSVASSALPYDVAFDVADEDMGKIFDFDEPKTTR